MNLHTFDRKAVSAGPRGPFQVAVADTAGMVWAHSNPAELYRWISLRNDLLKSISVAFNQGPSPTPRSLAGRRLLNPGC